MKLLALVMATAYLAAAQSVIDYTKVPSCARQQCTVLDQAEKNCVPPAAPVTDQSIYQSCLCQSTLLTQLHTSGSLCQTAGCSAEDATKISQYYIALCNGRVVEPAPTTTATTTTSTTSTSTHSTTAGAAMYSVTPSPPYMSMKAQGRWVVMGVVIAVGVIVIWIAAALLKRRHNRKKAAQRANMAASDAPYVPPAPSSKATPNNHESSEMAMSGGANGMPKSALRKSVMHDAAPAMRSRSSTLQSLALGNSSRTQVSQPVAWGPHQNMAHLYVNSSSSASNSVPPSPTVAFASPPPNPAFLNREAVKSEPRFPHYRSSQNSVTADSNVYSSAQGTPGHHVGWTPSAEDDKDDRPRTATGESISTVNRRTLSAVQSGSTIQEPQSAEICEVSPAKPNKLQKH